MRLPNFVIITGAASAMSSSPAVLADGQLALPGRSGPAQLMP